MWVKTSFLTPVCLLYTSKGKFEAVYSAQHAQLVYQENRKRSVRPIRQRKQDREAIEHYMRQNYSPEMIVKAKRVQVPVSTIYYWIHHGKLSLRCV